MTSSAPGVVGGAAVPHAPQFWTMPDTEDHDQVGRVRDTMAGIGKGLRALDPDVVLIVANDHLDNFVLRCVPSFTVHVGPSASGQFAGRAFTWPVASTASAEIVHRLQDQGFDPAFSLNATIGYEFGIPLDFLGFAPDTPLIPVYVNTYVAPQPRPERCYAFGQALDRALAASGIRAVAVASGGLSHYPGTTRYPDPDVDTDRDLFDRLAEGNLRALLGFDQQALDRTGNVEVRSWQILAGALGERRPDVTAFEPSWHHTYAVLGWTTGERPPEEPLHYPPLRADRLALIEALYALRMEAGARQRFLDDPSAFAGDYDLDDDERTALLDLDEARLRGLGIHALLGFLARLQVDLERRKRDQEPTP